MKTTKLEKLRAELAKLTSEELLEVVPAPPLPTQVFGCHVDKLECPKGEEPEIYSYCYIECGPKIDGCDKAVELHAQGKKKEDCPHWRPIE